MQNTKPLFTEPMPEPPKEIRLHTRTAFKQAVLEGVALADAAQAAGVATATLENALTKPEVQAYVNALKDWKDRKDTVGRQGYLGEALDNARTLMTEAKSEAVKMRAIEFLHSALATRDSGGRPTPLVSFTQNIAPGFSYGPEPDTISDPDDSQVIDHKD